MTTIRKAPSGNSVSLLNHMNPILVTNALEKVHNPNTLVNLVSQRLRQLNRGGGGRPLVSDIAELGAADIALREIIEDKIGFRVRRPRSSLGKEPSATRALEQGWLAKASAWKKSGGWSGDEDLRSESENRNAVGALSAEARLTVNHAPVRLECRPAGGFHFFVSYSSMNRAGT